MNRDQIIEKTATFVKNELSDAEGGHDWFHTFRVWKIAKEIAQREKVDMFKVELGALLHDIADSKFHAGNEEIGPQKARNFLNSLYIEESIITAVEEIIRNISFSVGLDTKSYQSPELGVVQDADRLDAIGAIGTARAFNYGGFKNRQLFNPDIKPNMNLSKEKYKNSHAPTLNHFYEKLLLLKDKMNTQTGRMLAQHRHEFMEHYLEEFLKEWNGEL